MKHERIAKDMKLYLNATSPYARLVRIALIEADLIESTELIWCDPWSDEEDLLSHNPIGRIPTLITSNGTAIAESLLILQYISQVSGIPARSETDYQLAGTSQGLMDAAFNYVISRKHAEKNSALSLMDQRRDRAIRRTLQSLEKTIQVIGQSKTLRHSDIAIAVALDYIDFRLPEYKIIEKYPTLNKWRQTIVQRPSFLSTTFV